MTTQLTAAGSALPSKPVLTLEVARQMILEAEAEGQRNALSVTIAVVDDGGHLLHFSRMDGAHIGTVDVATAKARTAALFRKPTQNFAESLSNGVSGLLGLPNMLPFAGGVPIVLRGLSIGAIGVSGAAPDMDAKIAQAGASVILRWEK